MMVQAASAQTLSVVAGNGQAACVGCPGTAAQFLQTLVLKATDASGNPMSGVTVNWSALHLNLLNPTTTTGPDGTTLQTVLTPGNFLLNAFQTFNQYAVTAQAGDASTTFYLTQFIPTTTTAGFNISPYQVSFGSIAFGTPVNGQVGAVSSTSFQVHVQDGKGNPVPNVAVSLVGSPDNESDVNVRCATTPPGAGVNIALTDASGFATCTPVFVSPGSGQFSLLVGTAYIGGDITQPPVGISNSLPISFNVTPGESGNITIISGNNQTAAGGQALLAPLVAEVDSVSNQPLAGQTVNWTVSPSNAGTLGSATTTTNSSGQVSNTLTLTSGVSGLVQVTARLVADPSKSVTFNVTAGQPVQVTGFSIVSGNNQSTQTGSAFAQPLVVQVTTSSGSGGRHSGYLRGNERTGDAVRDIGYDQCERPGAGDGDGRQFGRLGDRHGVGGRRERAGVQPDRAGAGAADHFELVRQRRRLSGQLAVAVRHRRDPGASRIAGGDRVCADSAGIPALRQQFREHRDRRADGTGAEHRHQHQQSQ